MTVCSTKLDLFPELTKLYRDLPLPAEGAFQIQPSQEATPRTCFSPLGEAPSQWVQELVWPLQPGLGESASLPSECVSLPGLLFTVSETFV